MKTYYKFYFLCLISFIVLFADWGCKSGNEKESKPNVILIMADDMGYECLEQRWQHLLFYTGD